jgi:hypothetical protein
LKAEGSSDPNSLSAEFDALTDGYAGGEPITANANSPWNAIQNYHWHGPDRLHRANRRLAMDGLGATFASLE